MVMAERGRAEGPEMVLSHARLSSGLRLRPTAAEVDSPMPGDALLRVPTQSWTVRSLSARTPEDVWPWLAQLGKHRAGW